MEEKDRIKISFSLSFVSYLFDYFEISQEDQDECDALIKHMFQLVIIFVELRVEDWRESIIWSAQKRH